MVEEYFHERAAIMEFCGGMTKAEAEKRARVEALAYRDKLKGEEDGEAKTSGLHGLPGMRA